MRQTAHSPSKTVPIQMWAATSSLSATCSGYALLRPRRVRFRHHDLIPRRLSQRIGQDRSGTGVTPGDPGGRKSGHLANPSAQHHRGGGVGKRRTLPSAGGATVRLAASASDARFEQLLLHLQDRFPQPPSAATLRRTLTRQGKSHPSPKSTPTPWRQASTSSPQPRCRKTPARRPVSDLTPLTEFSRRIGLPACPQWLALCV